VRAVQQAQEQATTISVVLVAVLVVFSSQLCIFPLIKP
jgi:hypothetical protein